MPSDFAVNTWALLLNCNCASMCELCCTTCCNQTEVADVVSIAPWGSKASSWVSLAEAESLPDPDDVRPEMLWALCIVLLVLEMSDFDRLGHYRSGLLIVFSRCVIIFFHCRFNACLNHFHLRQSENLASSCTRHFNHFMADQQDAADLKTYSKLIALFWYDRAHVRAIAPLMTSSLWRGSWWVSEICYSTATSRFCYTLSESEVLAFVTCSDR